jgi:hypothetical protein
MVYIKPVAAAAGATSFSEIEEYKKREEKTKEVTRAAIRKLTNVDNFLDELWQKVDNRELSKHITELRDAINLLNSN